MTVELASVRRTAWRRRYRKPASEVGRRSLVPVFVTVRDAARGPGGCGGGPYGDRPVGWSSGDRRPGGGRPPVRVTIPAEPNVRDAPADLPECPRHLPRNRVPRRYARRRRRMAVLIMLITASSLWLRSSSR